MEHLPSIWLEFDGKIVVARKSHKLRSNQMSMKVNWRKMMTVADYWHHLMIALMMVFGIDDIHTDRREGNAGC